MGLLEALLGLDCRLDDPFHVSHPPTLRGTWHGLPSELSTVSVDVQVPTSCQCRFG